MDGCVNGPKLGALIKARRRTGGYQTAADADFLPATRTTCAPIRTKVDMADTAAWLAVWGDWCCGWGRPAHHDPRVTVDQQGRALCPDCRRWADG